MSSQHQRPKGELEREVRHIAGEVDGWRRDALLEAAGLLEQLEATQRERDEYREVLERIVRRHQWREPEELKTLAFTMKEDALEVLASYPASSPEKKQARGVVRSVTEGEPNLVTPDVLIDPLHDSDPAKDPTAGWEPPPEC